MAYKDTITKRGGQEDLILIHPLKGIVGNEQLLAGFRDRGSALKDDIVYTVDLFEQE